MVFIQRLINNGMKFKEYYANQSFYLSYICDDFRDVAQPGSARRSGRRGRWFESSHPDLSGSGFQRLELFDFS